MPTGADEKYVNSDTDERSPEERRSGDAFADPRLFSSLALLA